MDRYIIVDTDVFSIIFNGANAADYASRIKGSIPVLSFISIGELYFGARKHGWGERRLARLDEQIQRYLIAPADEDLGQLWGELRAQAHRSGHCLAQAAHANDLWICATAIYYGAPLLTNNRRHFESFPGLSLC